MQNTDTTSPYSRDVLAQKVAELRKVFPEVFNESYVDFDKLKSWLGEYSDTDGEKFGLSWTGKENCKKIIQKRIAASLKPDRAESLNFDDTGNIYIEGDNLLVLKLLQKSYFGKIKMIYIDPPYNTGNEFVYPDNLQKNLISYLRYSGQLDDNGNKTNSNLETNGRFHSKWLNMIFPRLYLARNLLRPDGAIFISIDDNEFAHLKLMCDEIFGVENHVGVIAVRVNPGGRDYGGIARTHDYLLVYAKSEETQINELEDFEKKFPYADESGGFETRELRNRNIVFNRENRPNLYYPFYLNTQNSDENGFYEISLEEIEGWEEVWPKESQGKQTVWRWGREKAQKNLNTELVGKSNNNGGFHIVEKYRKNTKIARSIWDEKDVLTEKGTLLVKKLFDGKVFDFPKSCDMLMRAISMGSDKDSIILDFFSGSATTAHAVMELNKIDGGNRKFIMVQLPEPVPEKSPAEDFGLESIADIGRERIRRASKYVEEKYSGELELEGSSKPDLGFKAFKLSKSNFIEWEGDNIEELSDLDKQLSLQVDNLDSDSTADSVLYEILLSTGYTLDILINKTTIAGKDVYAIEDGAVYICLDKDLNQAVFDEMATANPSKVIFLDEGFQGNDELKSNAIQTFRTTPESGTELIFVTY